MNLRNILESLIAAGQQAQQANLQPSNRPSNRPSRLEAPTRPQSPQPSQKYFPNRTNYGVPEDNMIDTSMGYLNDDQFNQGMSGRFQGTVNPTDMDMVPRNQQFAMRSRFIQPWYQGSNPFMSNPYQNNYSNVNPVDIDQHGNSAFLNRQNTLGNRLRVR
jgi:hypothetical protein